MKLLDKVIEASTPVREILNSLNELSSTMKSIAESLTTVAHNQMVHHQMISQMWNIQQQVFKKMAESTLDASFPDIKSTDDKSSVHVDSDEKQTSKHFKPKPN